MAEELPKVSIIIPHFNMHSLLPEAVKSVVDQQYKNIELIVVDDGSEKKVSHNQFNLAGTEFKLFQIEHAGKSQAVNTGIREATGEYLTILDADDQLPGGSIAKRVTAMEENRADLSIGSFEVKYNGEIKAIRDIDTLSHQSNTQIERALLTNIISPLHQNGMLFRRELVDRVGAMDPKMLRGQDKDFAVRLLRESNETVFIKESVYIYNRYDRPISKRFYNRCVGMKYKLLVINKYSSGWRRIVYLTWGILVESAKLIHDIFGVYKK